MRSLKHLSNLFDGCFYLFLLLIAACSTATIATSPPNTNRPDTSKSDTSISSQSSLLDIGFAQIIKPTQVSETINFQHSDQVGEKTPTFKITAVGDIMLGTNYPFNHLADYGIDLLIDVKSILRNSDISFGNLEGVLLDEGEPAKLCQDLKRCYVFRSPLSYAKQLKNAGFTMLSLANNHSRDFGDLGRLSTMAALEQQGILHSGIVNDFATVIVHQHKIIMIAFAPFRGVNDMLDIALASSVVKELAKLNHIVIVSMHAGAEGEDKTRLPFATEYFYNEDRGDVVKFARAMVDSGADIVLGHGPHVPRAMELYKDRLIAYSLGNFATYYGINVAGKRGLAPILELEVSHQGHFLSGQIHSFRQNRPYGPQLDSSHSSAKLIQKLSKLDFPDNLLQITNNGAIHKLRE